ncbi:hypothetical protein I4U23_030475 [Adineta vaga]|nr:hypothetical protein I4U23_030475 [Adineta vaga]
MTYHIKKEYLKNWDIQQRSDNSTNYLVAADDNDEDIYISERSSITSSNDTGQMISSSNNRLPTPIPSSRLSPRKTPHSLRYTYNNMPENGIPIAIQHQRQQKEEKIKKQNLRKAPPGQGNLVPIPQLKPSDTGDNYYPYWYYYKVKNPDWIARQRQANQNKRIPYATSDPSKYHPQPALTTLSIKPKKRTQKSRQNDLSNPQTNQNKQHYDYSEKNSVTPPYVILHQNHENNQQQQPTKKRYIPLKDVDNNEYREQQMTRKIIPERRKLTNDNEWTDHYLQSISNKQSQNLSNLLITSKPIANRTKPQSKNSDKHFFTSDMNDDDNYHPHTSSQQNHSQSHHRHHHHSHHHPSIPSENNHVYYQTHLQNHQDESHQQHIHIRRRSSSGAYVNSDVQVVDVLYDTTDQTHHPPYTSVLYNQTDYLPSITHIHQQKGNTNRYPSDYYGTLSRQLNNKTYQKSIRKTKNYKSDLHSRFTDHHHHHHLHNVIDKRLVV